MIKIGLDLAVRTVGLAIRGGEANELIYKSFTSKEKNYFKLQVEMVDWVFDEILQYLQFNHQLVLEGIFTGVNPKAAINAARTQGGIIDRYSKLVDKEPIVITAVTARNRADIPVKAQKAEIQLIITKRYNLGDVSQATESEIIRTRNSYELLIERIKQRRKAATKVLKERLKKEQAEAKKIFSNTMKRMSTQIKKEIGLDEHMADAIVLTFGE